MGKILTEVKKDPDVEQILSRRGSLSMYHQVYPGFVFGLYIWMDGSIDRFDRFDRLDKLDSLDRLDRLDQIR